MTDRPYKELFDRLKEIGMFADYKSYEEYRKDPSIRPPTNLEEWKKTLSEEDKGRFNKIFN